MNISPEIVALIAQIKSDRTHGASELAQQAAGVLKTVAEYSTAKSVEEFIEEQKMVGELLMSVRPAMAPIRNIVARLLDMLSGKPEEAGVESIRRFTVFKADGLVVSSIQAVAQIARNALKIISNGDTVMTHSYSSTVLAALKEANKKYRGIEVIVTRSGVGRTGVKMAQELAETGVSVTLIDDTAVGLYITKCKKAVVGADRVGVDGSLVNGVGTYQLAYLAKLAGIPLYVLCETLKFDPRLRGDQVNLEEKEPAEVAWPAVLSEKVRVKNPYFDVTPPQLISGVVTEDGLLNARGAVKAMKALAV